MKQQLNKTTALYCRLSCDDVCETGGFASNDDSMSIQNQKSMLKRYADENGYINCQFFVDDGVSGTTSARQGFQSMIAEIENGKIGTVVVKDLSRLGREYLQTGYYTDGCLHPVKRIFHSLVFSENSICAAYVCTGCRDLLLLRAAAIAPQLLPANAI